MITPTRAGRLAVLASLSLASPPARAADVTLGDIVIHQPWARATPGGAEVGGGYLTVENKGSTPDRLTGGSLAASAGFELHSMSMDGGIMRMRPVAGVEIPPGRTVTLDPAGLHIMFTGLKRGLKTGESVPGTLTFAHAGVARVEFAVEGIGAKGPSRGPAAGAPMPGMETH